MLGGQVYDAFVRKHPPVVSLTCAPGRTDGVVFLHTNPSVCSEEHGAVREYPDQGLAMTSGEACKARAARGADANNALCI